MGQDTKSFDLVMKALGVEGGLPKLKDQPLDMPHSPDEAHDRVAYHSFLSRVKDILQPRTKRGNDRIFTLDFSGLRLKLGDAWDARASKIHAKIHGYLEENLIPYDIYLQRDDVSYFIVISGVDQDMARLKIRSMLEDILVKVLNTKSIEVVKVRQVNIAWPKQVKFEDLPTKNEIIQSMVSAEDAHRNFVFSQEEDDVSGDFLADVKCIYRPMLSVRTRIISTYICIPIKPNGHGGFDSGYDMLGAHPSIDSIFELDSFVQDAADVELQALLDKNMRSLLALPVHFETLASHRRQQYLTHARELFEQYKNRIVFELVGVPDHIPQSRMLEFTSSLRPHCRAIIARFPATHGAFEAYRSVGLHAVGVDLYSPDKPEKMIFKSLEQFIEHAHQTQLKTYAHGIHSVSLYTSAISAGFDYLDGYALSSVADEAHDIKPFSYDMIYRDLSSKSEGRKRQPGQS